MVTRTAVGVIYAERCIDLKLWHGFNSILMLSLLTVAFGAVLSVLLIKKEKLVDQWRKINLVLFPVQMPEVFAKALEKFVIVSENKTKLVQHGYHRYYILTIILFAAGLLWLQLYLTWGWHSVNLFTFQPFYISVLVVAIVLSTLFSVLTRSRIAAIIAMGLPVTGWPCYTSITARLIWPSHRF